MKSLARLFKAFLNESKFKILYAILSPNLQIFYVLNRVNLAVAKEICSSNSDFSLIIYSPQRISKCELTDSSTTVLTPDSRAVRLAMIARQLLGLKDSLYIPHHRIGTLLKILIQRVNSLNLIDDGLDSYRIAPKNIDLNQLFPTLPYYVLGSRVPLAPWTEKLKIVEICSLAKIADNNLEGNDLSFYDHVIFESPGIPKNLDGIKSEDKVVIWRHPNLYKRKEYLFEAVKMESHVSNVEKSVLSVSGTIHVGETMLVPFIISEPAIKCKVKLYINSSMRENLISMISAAEKDGRFSLVPV